MPRPKARSYCVVYGCLNNSTSKPDYSFFKLPSDLERRSKWLRLILREDLMNKTPHHYAVCEEHFETTDVLPGMHRKTLKNGSIPSVHLPEIPVSVQTSPGASASSSVTREINVIRSLPANDNTQTTELISDAPRKRKLISEPDPIETRKVMKLHETDDKTEKYEVDHFHKLCDTFLTKELADLVKVQTHLKYSYSVNRNNQTYKMLCWNLYCISPRSYRLLHSAMCLPTPSTLRRGITVTTEVNDELMAILKIKVLAMTDMEKNCSVVIDTTRLQSNLSYNSQLDNIFGFQEIDGVQSPEPTTNALVVMVRGIFTKWKQPVGLALLSESKNYDTISKWIDKLLLKLFEIGLNIRTFISDIGLDLYNAAKKRFVSAEQPYFNINYRKIYYIFDAAHLIKLARDSLIANEFHFQDRVAKYEHIVQFYENDKQKSYRLAQKLTKSHIHPSKLEKLKVQYATQLFSNSVAAGLSTYIDFNVIQESGRNTVELIRIMNNLFDALNSSNLKDSSEYTRPFCGEESQISFFKEMLLFFQHLILIHPKNRNDVTSKAKFIEGFQITIRSILLLFEDLKSEGCKSLFTSRLKKDVLENFFEQIRTKHGLRKKPTSRQYIAAFKEIFFLNVLIPPKTNNYAGNLEIFFIQTSEIVTYLTKLQLKEKASLNVKKGITDADGEEASLNGKKIILDTDGKKASLYVNKEIPDIHIEKTSLNVNKEIPDIDIEETSLIVKEEIPDIDIEETSLIVKEEIPDIDIEETSLNVKEEIPDIDIEETPLIVKEEIPDIHIEETSLNVEKKIPDTDGGEASLIVKKEIPDTDNEEPDFNVQITSSDFDKLYLPDKNTLLVVCVYLLEKCLERDFKCDILKSHLKPDKATFSSDNRYKRYREYNQKLNNTLQIVPSDDFVQYVEKLDDIIRQYFQREHKNYKISEFIYKQMDKIGFAKPCQCFPIAYLKKLFIRTRIFHIVKLNNTAFLKFHKRRKYFTVNKL